MENRIDRLIWESKKSGKPVNPWAICTASVGNKIGSTKRADWTETEKKRYDKCLKDIIEKSSLKEHHGEDWDPKILDMSLNTFLDKLKAIDKFGYNKIEDIIEKNKSKMLKEGRINEYGGYDDLNMYARHAGSYMANLKNGHNTIATVLNGFNTLKLEVLDDNLRREIERFLTQLEKPLDNLAKAIINTEKRHLKNLRGGRPTSRPEE